MQADFVLDYDVLPLNEPCRLHLMARFVTGPALHTRTRRPLNLSLVIDRSGSMAGDKLDFTRQAAQFLVQNLSANDTLSIVLYNDHVETLLLPEKVKRKDAINQRIGAVTAGGTTNLSSGWLEGCNLVSKNMDEGQVNRVILMSDGLANRGVTSTEQLVIMARQKFEENITTTTMGLGTDFNEDLLMSMANAGGGAYYFIESPEITPHIFQEELNGLLNVVGQNLSITITPGDQVRVINQLNAYPQHSDGQTLSYRLGDVFAEEVKALVLELSLNPFTQAGSVQVATLTFEYDELLPDAVRRHRTDMPVMVNIGEGARADIVSVNPEVNQSVLLLRAAQARRHAVEAADKGEFKTAAHVLRVAADAIQHSKIHHPHLLEEQNALRKQADDLEQGKTGYSHYQRKTMSTQAFYTMTSRHEDTMMLRVRENERGGAPPPPASNAGDGAPGEHAHKPTIEIERKPGITPTHVTWKNQTYRLEGDLIRIGRSRHNEIILMAKGVSRFHCQIKRSDGQLLLEDLGSTNGTSVDGEMVEQPHVLSVGEVAMVCDEQLVFHDGSYA
ncbi:MAG: hypothetical protein OHK0046_40520 [Anaerolineae bacterium]